LSQSRATREQDFWNGLLEEETRTSAWKFYEIAQSSAKYHADLVMEDCAGKKVLEYGCYTGTFALDLARRGATVVGIDVSTTAIEMARKQAAAEGLADNPSFEVMNAEELTFAPRTFDRVCGRSILHHLDLPKALGEIRRVLKPGGRAVFYEPLGANPLINLYRRLTPQMRSPDERPLSSKDLGMLHSFFSAVDIRYFHLTGIAAVVWRRRPGFATVLRSLEAVDRALFTIPLMRRQAWIAVITLS
jgi:SAM-dependent methyltransferase